MYKRRAGPGGPAGDIALQVLVMNFAADPARKDHEFVAINPVIVEAPSRSWTTGRGA